MKARQLLFKSWIITAMILMNFTAAQAQWIINESFEGGAIPAGWAIYDANGDNSSFRAFNKPTHAHTGNWIAMVDCYDNDGNDWLCTPQVTVQTGDRFIFWARAWYGTEKMNVKLSTSGNAISNFNVSLASNVSLSATYQEFSYDLSAYAGQSIYLAIQWQQETYAIIVDDVKVGKPMPNDVGVISIESPGDFHVVNETVIPAGTVKNYGTSEVTVDFPVTCTITDEQANVVYTATNTYTATLAAGLTGTIDFTAWTPATPGTYQVAMYTALAGDALLTNDTTVSSTQVGLHYGTGGPDAMGYEWIDSGEPGGPAYNWIDISATGTSTIMYGVDAFSGDDNFSEPIPLGFNFPFYGINRTFFHADINGTLLLADNNWYKPFPDNGWGTDGNIFNYTYPIPGYTGMPALVAVFWDDLKATEGTGNIYYQTFGTSPDQYCVIQWNNLKFASGNGGSSTLAFQVILHENGDIVMQYQNVDNGQSGGANPHVLGQSSTIGIQNDNYTSGLSYLTEIVQNGAWLGPEPIGNLLHNNMAIRFFLGEDLMPPMFTTQKVWNTFDNEIDITAHIIDASGIVSDTLYYNTGSGWNGITHTSFEEPDVYHYNLQNLPLGATIEYYFAATDNSVNHNRGILNQLDTIALSFKVLPTAGTEVLVLTPGNTAGFQDYQNLELPKYITALDNLGITYDIYNWAAYERYTIPADYKIIMAYSNNTGNSAIHDTLTKALINFMDSGTEEQPKNVFFASDNLGYAQQGLPNDRYLYRFFAAYLRAGYNVQPNPPSNGGSDGLGGPDTPGYHSGSFMGMQGSPVGTPGLEIPVLADSPDALFHRDCPDWFAGDVTNPTISSQGSFKFEDGPISGNAYSKNQECAVWLDNLIYKSFFLSFDLSQLTNPVDIDTLVSQVIEWFTPVPFYDITTTVQPAQGGTVTGAGTYQQGATATLTATENNGYTFLSWNENGTIVSYDPVYSFTVTSDRNLEALFEGNYYTISAIANPAEGGTIEGAGTYQFGTVATLTATPAVDYEFINWTENGNIASVDPQYSFTVSGNTELTANFAIITYDVILNAAPAEGGAVTGEGSYPAAGEVILTATPATDFAFVCWTENGDTLSTEATYTFTIDADRIITANFKSTVGVGNMAGEKITISPNPAHDQVTIRCGNLMIDRIDLYNLTTCVQTVAYLNNSNGMNAGSPEITLNLTSLPAGIYFVRVTFDHHNVSVFKLIHL